MTSRIHEAMHAEHKNWESEIGFWRDELAEWQKELADAESDLSKLKTAFDNWAEMLRKHAAALRMMEQDSDAHEHALASFEMGGSGNDLLGFAKKHDSESSSQSGHRDAHEKIKREHHALIAKWKSFVKLFVSTIARDQT